MANTYTNALASLSDTNNTLVYTVPADTTAIINAIHVTNVLGSDATITVKLENTLTSFCLIKATALSNSSLILLAIYFL